MKKQSKLEKIEKRNYDLSKCLNRGNYCFCEDCASNPQEEYGCNQYYTKKIKRMNIIKGVGFTALALAPPVAGGIIAYFHPNPHINQITNTLIGAGVGITCEAPIALLAGIFGAINQMGDSGI